MINILTLQSPEELLRSKREYILQEIELHHERELDNLNQALKARKARKELENQLFEFNNTIEILEELV